MPAIYLSPSTQEKNPYITGGTEEDWMNLLADTIEPYLTASGIRVTRNTPQMTAGSSIEASNNGLYDLHLALHSNAAPESRPGSERGIIAYYYPGSALGRKSAELASTSLKVIYPLPNLVTAQPTTAIGEVRRIKSPSLFLEIGYHDNPDDATWIINNIPSLGYVIALAVTEYLGVPFLTPQPLRSGVVNIQDGVLNVRDRPSAQSTVIATLPKNSPVTILNQWQDWLVIMGQNVLGWVNAQYIQPI